MTLETMTFETIDKLATVIVANIIVVCVVSAVISWAFTMRHERLAAKAKRQCWEAEVNKITADTTGKEKQ